MALNQQQRQQVKYFRGVEVEHTPMLGRETLFLVGCADITDIEQWAEHRQHIYLGTSQSFSFQHHSSEQWSRLIAQLLDLGYTVTLDLEPQYASWLTEQSWCQHPNFIAMISVKLPCIDKLNANTTVKLDDTAWGHSNPGVWCCNLQTLQHYCGFTAWDSYALDSVS